MTEHDFGDLINRNTNFRPLHRAASPGLPKTASALIELGADPELQSIDGLEPHNFAKAMYARAPPHFDRHGRNVMKLDRTQSISTGYSFHKSCY